MDIVRHAVGQLTWLLAFLPEFVRPWIFLALALTLLWFLLARLWLFRFVYGIGTVLFGVVGIVAAVMLYVEFRVTRHRRGPTGAAPEATYRFGGYWENVLNTSNTTVNTRRSKVWRPHRWPVKSIMVVALLGLPLWLVGSLSPSLASAQGPLGGAYGHWAAFEDWTGVAPNRQALISTHPPSTIMARDGKVYLALGPRWTATEVSVFTLDPAGQVTTSPAVVLRTDGNGDSAKKVGAKLAKSLRRGQLVELRYDGHRERVRVS